MDQTRNKETSDLQNKTGAAVEPSGQTKQKMTQKQLEVRHRGVIAGDWKQLGSSSKGSQEQSTLTERR